MTESLDLPADGRQLRRWAALSLVNLAVVAALGLLLRYKGAFYLPGVNYKYLLNAHSHFAFSGWITTALFVGLLYVLGRAGGRVGRVYRWLFWFNQLASGGMLISFMIQGYGPVAIFFSALSVVFSYWFAFCYWRDQRRCLLPPVVSFCLRLALMFLVVSSAGPYLLAYSMAHRLGNMTFYYNSIYLYLHFQYNGWFSFGVLGLFMWMLHERGASLEAGGFRWVVGLMGAACVPAYALSLLWTEPPVWLRVMAGSAGVVQVAAVVVLGISLWRRSRGPGSFGLLWTLSMIAFVIKIALQALSVVPALGAFAFGFRPVIVAYLHLVVLGFVSFFLLGFFIRTGLSAEPLGWARLGLSCFIVGVIANEVILLVQSGLAMAGVAWMGAPYYLLGAAILLFVGAVCLTAGQPVIKFMSVVDGD